MLILAMASMLVMPNSGKGKQTVSVQSMTGKGCEIRSTEWEFPPSFPFLIYPFLYIVCLCKHNIIQQQF